jgi:hypothetical protein
MAKHTEDDPQLFWSLNQFRLSQEITRLD